MTALESLASRCASFDCAALVASKKVAAVYVLSLGERVVYVGSTNRLLGRIGDHSRRWKFDRVLWFVVPHADRLAYEGALWRFFQPENGNKVPLDRGRDAEILAELGLSNFESAAPVERTSTPRKVRTAVIGQLLRTARKNLGRVQSEVADALGRTQSFISQMESGRLMVPAQDIQRVAEVYGLDVAVLLSALGHENNLGRSSSECSVSVHSTANSEAVGPELHAHAAERTAV